MASDQRAGEGGAVTPATTTGEHHVETYARPPDSALGAMNEAVRMTAEQGPAAAIEYIADYLNDRDAVDEEMLDQVPADWLTRWKVEAKPTPPTPPQLCDRAHFTGVKCPTPRCAWN